MAGTTPHSPHSLRRPAARWLVVIFLAVIATCLLVELGFTSSAARGQIAGGVQQSAAGRDGGKRLFAVAGQVTKDTYGLYLVDLENDTICMYQYLPGTRRLRLMAARTFIYDCQLDEYNTEPLPREIKSLVEQHRRLKGVAPRSEGTPE